MRRMKKYISMLLALILAVQLCPLSVLAAETPEDPRYKNFVILGDSICLGFSTESASMTAVDTFDLASNVYRAANAHNSKGESDKAHDYTHCYPTLLAKRLGIDTFQNNEVQNIFTPGDAYDDVYNFGVCAAWSEDIYELLTEPFHPYEYYTYNYDEDTTFVLPKAYTGTRGLVDTDAPGYDIGNPFSWVYRTAEVDTEAEGFDPDDRDTWVMTKGEKDWIKRITRDDGGGFFGEDNGGFFVEMKEEEYTIPEGTEIPVASVEDYGFGASLVLNPIIQDDYYFIGKNCLDEDGNFKDTNGDGKIDNYDIYYYPCRMDFDWSTWAVKYVCTASEEEMAVHGEPILNPQFTKYYYNYMTDKIENGDLIALACGGNDVYHTFMDKYMAASMMREDGSINVLASLLYYINYALQTNMTVGQIMDMLSDENVLSMLGIDLSDLMPENGGAVAAGTPEVTVEEAPAAAETPVVEEAPAAAETPVVEEAPAAAETPVVEEAPAATETPVVEEAPEGIAPANELVIPENGNGMGLFGGFGSIISMEDITWLLDYYSGEKVTAYMQGAIENYKFYYEECIKRCLELKEEDAELILVGHYNPFGMTNYFQMLSMAFENGQLMERLSGDMGAVASLIQGLIGTGIDYQKLENLSEEELQAAAEQDMATLGNIFGAYESLSETVDDEQLTQMVVDLSFPLVVLLMNDALSGTYTEFNDFVGEMAEKYDLAYVDVSEAPTSGRYDPHPTEYGHQWIADRIYETVVPEINASISPASTGEGTLSPEGNKEFRLRDSQTYEFSENEGSEVSAVFIDGQRIDDSDYESDSYTFSKIMQSHTFSVQFDKLADFVKKFTVNVVDSGANVSGAGLYESGATVTINAGTREGYVFTGWQAEGVTLADKNAATTSFVMPENDVTLTATWKVDKTEHESHHGSGGGGGSSAVTYTLSFETNGGSSVPNYTKSNGTTVDLSNFLTVRDGYSFGGWYADKELTEKVTSVKLTKDTTVYAKWNEKSVSVLPFNDVKETDWLYENVKYVWEHGIFNGISDTAFGPNINTTRGMIVTLLYRMEKEPEVLGSCPFEDVAAGSYYENAITWASNNGIVTGYNSDTFGPEDSITREQMAAILFRHATYKGYPVSEKADLSAYTDADSISGYAVDAMSWANANGLIAGTSATTLAPRGYATRGQVAAILHRFDTKFAV